MPIQKVFIDQAARAKNWARFENMLRARLALARSSPALQAWSELPSNPTITKNEREVESDLTKELQRCLHISEPNFEAGSFTTTKSRMDLTTGTLKPKFEHGLGSRRSDAPSSHRARARASNIATFGTKSGRIVKKSSSSDKLGEPAIPTKCILRRKKQLTDSEKLSKHIAINDAHLSSPIHVNSYSTNVFSDSEDDDMDIDLPDKKFSSRFAELLKERYSAWPMHSGVLGNGFD